MNSAPFSPAFGQVGAGLETKHVTHSRRISARNTCAALSWRIGCAPQFGGGLPPPLNSIDASLGHQIDVCVPVSPSGGIRIGFTRS
jgi:hypothetical protein